MPRSAPFLVTLALLAPSLLVAPLVAGAEPAPLAESVEDAAPRARVAVIDTGIALPHPEFAEGQVVAWWDFTDERKSRSQTDPMRFNASVRSWDPWVTEPFDSHGHGTATASLVAGLNTQDCGSSRYHEKMSFAPGADLVIAKVGKMTEEATGPKASIMNVGLAIRWAADMGADVISISLGVIAPVPIHLDADDLRYARSSGALIVVSAGNGLGNTGLTPYPMWLSSYGNSPDVLSVGSGDRDGWTTYTTTGNMDPDVTSWSERVCVADRKGGYTRMSGTSFSAPLVAGMAAAAMEVARANGAPDDAAHIERILLMSASNKPLAPYAREGMGFLLDREWPLVADHASRGTIPDAQEQGAHKLADMYYHDVVLARAKNTPFL